MIIPRRYSATINITAFTAQIDIFEIIAAANKPCVLIGFELGQLSEVGDAQEEKLVLILKRVTGAPTSGSGGGTPTFVPISSPNDTAAGVTAETGNTTKLTGGTAAEIARFEWDVRKGAYYWPTPEEMVYFDQATRMVLELGTTPADSVGPAVGRVVVGELI